MVEKAGASEQTLAYSVRDFCTLMDLGRTTFYKLLKKQEIKTIRIGGRRLVPAAEARRLLQQDGGCK